MVTKDMTIQSILEQHEDVAPILMASGMHCLGCAMAHGETLEQACAVHGIDVDALVQQINESLGE
jgi:hybrid cluster-associated redox disulfide protein